MKAVTYCNLNKQQTSVSRLDTTYYFSVWVVCLPHIPDHQLQYWTIVSSELFYIFTTQTQWPNSDRMTKQWSHDLILEEQFGGTKGSPKTTTFIQDSGLKPMMLIVWELRNKPNTGRFRNITTRQEYSIRNITTHSARATLVFFCRRLFFSQSFPENILIIKKHVVIVNWIRVHCINLTDLIEFVCFTIVNEWHGACLLHV